MTSNSSASTSISTEPVARPAVQRRAGAIAIGSGALFLTMSLVEWAFGLYPGAGTGAAFVANQLGFSLAMAGQVTAIVLLLTARHAARGTFALIAGTLQALGITALIAASLADLGAGTQESWLYPVGGMANMLGGLLLGIALALPGRLTIWRRWAAIAFAVVPAFIVTPVLIATENVLVESLLPLVWTLLGAALISDVNHPARA